MLLKTYKPHDTIPFGKYKGQSIDSIVTSDPQYFLWLMKNISNFFITQEDLQALIDKHPDLIMDDQIILAYNQKLLSHNPEETLSVFTLECSLWPFLCESKKNALAEKEFKKSPVETLELPYNDPLRVTMNMLEWCYVKLGVDNDCCPLITVFCRSHSPLTFLTHPMFKRYGYPEVNQPYQAYHFSVNMDSPYFGFLAKTLIQLNFLTIKKQS